MSGAQWVRGRCWRCDAGDLWVMWVGPVHSTAHGHAPFLACEPCIRRLEALVHEYHHQADRA